MTTYYSVVQFAPSPLSGERINIGVVAYDDAGAFKSHFLSNWQRVKSFCGRSTRPIEREVQSLKAELSVESLHWYLENARHSLEFTPLRTSLRPLDALLSELSATMLAEPGERKRSLRKTAVLREATVSLERTLHTKGLNHHIHVGSKTTVLGRLAPHELDLSLANGHVLLGAQAISFDREMGRTVDKDISEIAWILDDIASTPSPPRMAVLVAPPNETKRSDYTDAVRLFRDLRAEVVRRSAIERWAAALPKSLELLPE